MLPGNMAFRFYSKKLGIEMVENIMKVLLLANDVLGVNLNKSVSFKGYQKIENLHNWMQNQFKNDGDEALISIYHTKKNKSLAKLTCFDDYNFSLGAHLYTVLLVPKESDSTAMASLFMDACKILDPFGALVEPPEMREPIGRQIIAYDKKTPPPFGLPHVLEPRKEAYALHEFPQYLTWLNFWSTPMLQNIGYKPTTHDHLFHRVEPLEHGTVFQLTEQPTDPEIPEHLARLLAVYEVFPKIGGRHLIKGMDFS